ncbi:MAG: amino acid-binding protein [Kiritimatiellae bacterium]|nr:amino acid-binding protein [Kiritimatiellia bacterium]
MPLPQISLFLENKPGRLASVCHALTDGGVNIASLSLADTSDFGIVRLLVDKTDAARDLLKAAGFGVNVRDVVAIAAGDEPGTLAKVLDVIDTTGANIEYMYAFSVRSGDKAVLVFRFDKTEEAEKALEAAGFALLRGFA